MWCKNQENHVCSWVVTKVTVDFWTTKKINPKLGGFSTQNLAKYLHICSKDVRNLAEILRITFDLALTSLKNNVLSSHSYKMRWQWKLEGYSVSLFSRYWIKETMTTCSSHTHLFLFIFPLCSDNHGPVWLNVLAGLFFSLKCLLCWRIVCWKVPDQFEINWTSVEIFHIY